MSISKLKADLRDLKQKAKPSGAREVRDIIQDVDETFEQAMKREGLPVDWAKSGNRLLIIRKIVAPPGRIRQTIPSKRPDASGDGNANPQP
jgi:hypothetical protein